MREGWVGEKKVCVNQRPAPDLREKQRKSERYRKPQKICYLFLSRHVARNRMSINTKRRVVVWKSLEKFSCNIIFCFMIFSEYNNEGATKVAVAKSRAFKCRKKLNKMHATDTVRIFWHGRAREAKVNTWFALKTPLRICSCFKSDV